MHKYEGLIVIIEYYADNDNVKNYFSSLNVWVYPGLPFWKNLMYRLTNNNFHS